MHYPRKRQLRGRKGLIAHGYFPTMRGLSTAHLRKVLRERGLLQ